MNKVIFFAAIMVAGIAHADMYMDCELRTAVNPKAPKQISYEEAGGETIRVDKKKIKGFKTSSSSNQYFIAKYTQGNSHKVIRFDDGKCESHGQGSASFSEDASRTDFYQCECGVD